MDDLKLRLLQHNLMPHDDYSAAASTALLACSICFTNPQLYVSLFYASSSAGEKPVALTLKVDGETYVRLSTLRATQRRTNQDILGQALKEYLTRAGA